MKMAIYPGSFNPIHAGHEKIVDTLHDVGFDKIYLELTIKNADKGYLDHISLNKRIDSIKNRMPSKCHGLIISNQSLYIEKAAVIRQDIKGGVLHFALGVDAWNRMWNEKYGVSLVDLREGFLKYYTCFELFKRGNENPIINDYNRMLINNYHEIDVDISSSQIRKAQNGLSN